jgi:integrase/recombinase XerD
LRNPEIEKIGLEDVLQYLNDLKYLGWDQNVFQKKIGILKKFFKFFRDQEYKVLNYELLPQIEYTHKIPKVIDDENYAKLLKSIKTNLPDDLRNRALVMMLWDTGARNGEILSLNIEDIDLDQQKAVIRTEKAKFNRPFREIMWTRKTNEVLERYLKDKGITTGPLFTNLSNNYKLHGRLKINGLCHLLRVLCDKAKIPRYNPHSFRHHMAHDILEKGGSIGHVAKILGHASIKSSFNYIQLNDREMKDAYRRFKGD